ncbi:helix-turn-helix transcriptional regulator [Rhizobium herbae]|uniref:AraC family transcriptional regulator n=1 Tax=Rhizobium herbae TaxID=508661 RepID=A0ABS4EQW9_9HYPH|nr:AraC family transcriptional regulator [Rhizobium herbae]MBP1860329.1 AraC family transcriptional regulator [Rhizobium herbae]
MLDIDPQIFSISRPSLENYRAFIQRDMIVETYRSSAGEMVSRGSLHRISINRTAHNRYAYRFGTGSFRKVKRAPFTLGFQPAGIALEVDGDEADYISIFQSPNVYSSLVNGDFDPEHLAGDALSAITDPTTLQVALSLVLAVEQKERSDPLLVEHLGMALACCVVRLLGAAPALIGHRMTSENLRRVIDHIENLLGRADLSVEELAGVAHMSPFHFSREFKKAAGMAPHRFILVRRIERARLYLADGKETLSSIAYATGFSSQAHFSSVFRRLMGVTPKEYRHSVRI